MDFWQVVLAIFPPALILAAVFRSADKRDKKFDEITASIDKLADKVGAQNGRIGKLEERNRMEDSGWFRRDQ